MCLQLDTKGVGGCECEKENLRERKQIQVLRKTLKVVVNRNYTFATCALVLYKNTLTHYCYSICNVLRDVSLVTGKVTGQQSQKCPCASPPKMLSCQYKCANKELFPLRMSDLVIFSSLWEFVIVSNEHRSELLTFHTEVTKLCVFMAQEKHSSKV